MHEKQGRKLLFECENDFRKVIDQIGFRFGKMIIKDFNTILKFGRKPSVKASINSRQQRLADLSHTEQNQLSYMKMKNPNKNFFSSGAADFTISQPHTARNNAELLADRAYNQPSKLLSSQAA
jgi:hypothetical protein